MLSSVASGINPPTKIFLTGSFFMAIALLGSIKRPSSLCSFCSSTCGQVKMTQISHLRNIWVSTVPLSTEDTTRALDAYLFYTGRVFKEDKAKASGPAAIRVKLDGAIRHVAKFGEVVLQILFTCIPAEATNKHFTVNTAEAIEC